MKEFDYSNENILRTIKSDYFKRRDYLIYLADIVQNTEECTALAIDGSWGVGKTVFMQQFLLLLKDETIFNEVCKESKVKYPSAVGFYYNAWENDTVNNPAINLLNSVIYENSIFEGELKEATTKVLKQLTNIALKISTAGALGMGDIIGEDDRTTTIKDVRATFSDVINKIKENYGVEKVVIVIDELDRCRPDFAVDLLEELKHLYENKDLVFILATNINQLSNTIRKRYGNGFDAELYLQRFFDSIFTLHNSNSTAYIENELKFNINQSEIVAEVCKTAIKHLDMSAREINMFIKHIKTVTSGTIMKENCFYETDKVAKYLFVPLGLALKYKNLRLFEKYRTGKFEKDEIIEFVKSSDRLEKWLSKWLNEKEEEGFDVFGVLFKLYRSTFSTPLLDNNVELVRDQYSVNQYVKERIITMVNF